MDPQRPGEGLDRREQSLLKSGDEQFGFSLFSPCSASHSEASDISVIVEQLGEAKFGAIGRQPFDINLYDNSLRKSALELTDVLFEPPHHHLVEMCFENRDAAGEPIGI